MPILSILAALLIVSHSALARNLKIRVDDEVAVYQNGQTVVNTFPLPKSQYREIYDVELTSNLLVVVATNTGGPGGILASIDGEGISKQSWRCNSLQSEGQNPEDVYPGVHGLHFDDCEWGAGQSVDYDYGSTNGFADSVGWFWGGPQSSKHVVCRLMVDEKYSLKVQADDEVAVYQNGKVVLSTYPIPGSQYREVYDVSLTSSLLVLKVTNLHGPGGIAAMVDGDIVPEGQWRCAPLKSADQDPEDAYPGSLSKSFDDSAWESTQVVDHPTQNFEEGLAWVWGASVSSMHVMCRVKLANICN